MSVGVWCIPMHSTLPSQPPIFFDFFFVVGGNEMDCILFFDSVIVRGTNKTKTGIGPATTCPALLERSGMISAMPEERCSSAPGNRCNGHS